MPAGLDLRRGFLGDRLSGHAAGGSRIDLAGKVLAGLLSVAMLVIPGAALVSDLDAGGDLQPDLGSAAST